ncbi:hypothetical protein [Catalinimonas niigatensis]|uniref:hypothetical protein n=1 Tax=Catalinimonas niigatensis TaxID=1397264 RepID=UPI002666685D|nr:hypothetical protein [Catalinimonas niigatensis]WPP53588.1 hypothetical protein PZB72_14540 [Catalinimonas niigatensis]
MKKSALASYFLQNFACCADYPIALFHLPKFLNDKAKERGDSGKKWEGWQLP